MNIRRTFIAITILPLIFIISCKKDSNDNSGDEFPQEMRSVWQEEGWDDGDELGIYFTNNTMGSWDYMGDEYDEGDDCYYNWEVGELISYEGSNFRINMSSFFSEESEEATVSITVDGNLLSMSEPGDNDFTEEYSKDNRSVSNLTPKCSDSPKLKSDEMRDKVRMLFSN
jgi:hypothetical protein